MYARGVKDGETVISEKQFDILDTTPPTVTIASSSSTTNSISATATATDNETGMGANPKYIFYIKKTSDPDSTYVEIANSTNASVTKSGLEQDTSYTIKVEVADVAGNKGQTTKDITTSKIADAGDGLVSGAIVASTPVWSNGTASTTLSTDTGLTIQYQINGVDGSWTNETNVTGLHHKDTVFARLTDGTNYGGEASITILDIVAPSLATISLSGTLGNNGYYRSNVTVAITAGSDGQSGVNQVRYSVSGAQTVNETTTAAGTTSTSITISTDGTSTITAYTIDKAGNVSEAKKQVVNKDSTAPSTASLTTGTIGETSIAVTARGADATSGIYSYKFQRSTTSATSGFTTVATQTSTATSYSYTYTGLTDGITYYLRVIVTDKAGNTKTSTAITQKTNKKLATNVNELVAGDWVTYPSARGNIDCVVLYDSSSQYGVEIIAMENVEDVTLGYKDPTITGSNNFEKAKNSYNNAISTLNNATSKYNNTTYSDRVRCVGSKPNNPTLDNPGYFTISDSWFSSYNGEFKKGDGNSETDYNQMKVLGIDGKNGKYWYASRAVGTNSTTCSFYMSAEVIGGKGYALMVSVKSGGTYSYGADSTYGLRPVFRLKSNIKVTGGNGTESNPYILGTVSSGGDDSDNN